MEICGNTWMYISILIFGRGSQRLVFFSRSVSTAKFLLLCQRSPPWPARPNVVAVRAQSETFGVPWLSSELTELMPERAIGFVRLKKWFQWSFIHVENSGTHDEASCFFMCFFGWSLKFSDKPNLANPFDFRVAPYPKFCTWFWFEQTDEGNCLKMLGGQTDLWLVADVNVVGYLYGYNYNHGHTMAK